MLTLAKLRNLLLLALWPCCIWGGVAALAQETVPRGDDAPASAALVEPRQLRDWGFEALTRIQTDLAQPNGLYAEYGTPDGQRGADHGEYSFIWPASHQLRALAAAAKLQPRQFTPAVTKYVGALEPYWVKRDGLGGYAVLPGGEERYYDDNALMVLALLEAHDVKRERLLLTRAAETFKFVASGEAKTTGGGIRQHETKEGAIAVCTTGPATVLIAKT